MKTFRISVGGISETVKAKHIIGGNYYCRNIRTGNRLRVQKIGRLSGGGTDEYHVTALYPSSMLSRFPENEIKVTMV